MGRGKAYSEDELARLKALIKDNEKKKHIEIAEKAIAYGICTSRSLGAVAEKIGELRNDKPVTDDRGRVDIMNGLLDVLYDAIIASSNTIYLCKDGTYALRLDFQKISSAAKSVWPDRYVEHVRKLKRDGKIEDLKR